MYIKPIGKNKQIGDTHIYRRYSYVYMCVCIEIFKELGRMIVASPKSVGQVDRLATPTGVNVAVLRQNFLSGKTSVFGLKASN